ncbi:3-ketoacyl-CoA thiolase [Xylophilus ampelinus]|nr:3-ketoacyl-CoA thiolase [Xylophilus ampelinus]
MTTPRRMGRQSKRLPWPRRRLSFEYVGQCRSAYSGDALWVSGVTGAVLVIQRALGSAAKRKDEGGSDQVVDLEDPTFAIYERVTAGSASQPSDGAAACALVDEANAPRRNWQSSPGSLGVAVAPCDPDEIGTCPVYAARQAFCDRLALNLDGVDLWGAIRGVCDLDDWLSKGTANTKCALKLPAGNRAGPPKWPVWPMDRGPSSVYEQATRRRRMMVTRRVSSGIGTVDVLELSQAHHASQSAEMKSLSWVRVWTLRKGIGDGSADRSKSIRARVRLHMPPRRPKRMPTRPGSVHVALV